MRHTASVVCLTFAMALTSSAQPAQAQNDAELRAQISELESQLEKLKKEFACKSSGSSSAAAATASEQYRITYLGTIMVPADEVSGFSASGTKSASRTTSANVLSFDLDQATISANSGRLTTRSAGSVGFNLGALTAASGQNAGITIPLSSLTANGNSADASAAENRTLAVRVSGAAVRAAAARLSAAQRRGTLAFPDHGVVNSANFTSGIYRGTSFTAAPSASNPYVGRYVQTPDGRVNTVMPVGQQFIVLP